MKKIKITEQIHVLGTTFKDIYEIADYSHNGISKDGVYVGQLVRHHLWFDECDYLSDNYCGVALYLQNQKMMLKTNWKS